MKKTTQFIIVFILFLSNMPSVKANNWTFTPPFTLASTLMDTIMETPNKSWKDPVAAQKLKAHIDAKIAHLNIEKAKNKAKLDDSKAHLTEKQEDKIAAIIKDLDSRLAELQISKSDIDRLGKDKNHVYAISEAGENCVIKETDREIIIQGANDALLIHEIRHISLWLQTGRSFLFNKYGFLVAIYQGGIVDEVQGYRAQYAFAPTSLPGRLPKDIEHINRAFLANIKKDDHSFAYPSIRQIWRDDLKMAEQQAKVKKTTQGTYSSTTPH